MDTSEQRATLAGTRAAPSVLECILYDAAALGFEMSCDASTGGLLGTLAASKRGGRFLEIGSGAGAAFSWILAAMDLRSTLLSVDNDERVLEVARRHLGTDPRAQFVLADASETLRTMQGQYFDMIFADSWPGKFQDLELAIELLAPGAIYVVDDLLPQPTWPDGHDASVAELIDRLSNDARLALTKLSWSTGLIIATRLEDEQP
ncbi:MAG: class I SAM-dependent methyltransferase [Myxococcota bacterium]